MRILYTISNFDTAGSGRVLYDLAKGLDKSRFEVEIACGNANGAFFKEVERLGLPVHIMPITVPLRPYWSLWFRVKALRRFIKEREIDIVHSWHWSSDWSEALATKGTKAKYVFTKKAMSWGNPHWKIRSFLADYIITINPEMKGYFPNKKNQRLVPIGLDTDYYNRREKKQPQNGVFKIVTVANLVPVKGVEVLIEALHLLKNPAYRLEIVGDDQTPYARELKQLTSRLQLEKQITFCGKQAEVRPYYEAADLVVLPTKARGEGQPMALIEAMCMEAPVLGAAVSGIDFVLKAFPELLFEANNPKVLAEKIKWMSAKPQSEREDLGRQLRAHCVARFNIKDFIRAHETLYEEIGNRE